ncbi:hypothetical protein LENED_009168 [Lentinula edodes]|uniref:Uncharacterized protein n=1 Tax=Lentinula edodes TaxID=5353 RepID=A0A1Q3EJ05_LENED|nr:hypothetical protein LENED_009168 [Lentinula edodes]
MPNTVARPSIIEVPGRAGRGLEGSVVRKVPNDKPTHKERFPVFQCATSKWNVGAETLSIGLVSKIVSESPAPIGGKKSVFIQNA